MDISRRSGRSDGAVHASLTTCRCSPVLLLIKEGCSVLNLMHGGRSGVESGTEMRLAENQIRSSHALHVVPSLVPWIFPLLLLGLCPCLMLSKAFSVQSIRAIIDGQEDALSCSFQNLHSAIHAPFSLSPQIILVS